MKYILFIVTLALTGTPDRVWAHDGDDHDAEGRLIIGPDDQRSTWELIQQQVLDHHCVSCHHTGSVFARQSGLILTADVAYEQLVGTAPRNAAARRLTSFAIEDRDIIGLKIRYARGDKVGDALYLFRADLPAGAYLKGDRCAGGSFTTGK